jgi:hypothetical protein
MNANAVAIATLLVSGVPHNQSLTMGVANPRDALEAVALEEAAHVHTTSVRRCDVWCMGSSFYPTGRHTTYSGAPLPRDGVNHDGSCVIGGNCDTEHPFCSAADGFDIQRYEQLERAWQESDWTAVRAVVNVFPLSVRMNAIRSSIQVTNCEGFVVANLPVTGHILASIP